MDFVLTPQLIDTIAFAMEDQEERHAVSAQTGELVPLSAIPAGEAESGAWLRLPKWGSAEGFHLMESFVTTVENPAWRGELARALTMGRGVFRAFKDALKQSKELEKLWFSYKEDRLRGVIVSWYNAAREARGLERMPEEPEETEELVASDFSFSWGPGSHAADIAELDRDAFYGLFPEGDPARLAALYAEKRAGVPGPGEPGAVVLVAETPSGELAGFLWGVVEGTAVHLVQLAVAQGLRGIGLGENLLREFLVAMRGRGMRSLAVELMGRSLRSSDFFQSLGFTPVTQVMECSLDRLPF